MRREVDDDVVPRNDRQLLLDLGRMPMACNAVRMEALRHFAEQHRLLEPAPGSRGTRLRIDHDVVGIDQPGTDQREQEQQSRRRIAAGTGGQPRLRDCIPIVFGEPVDRFLLKLRRTVLVAVPLRVGVEVAQPEIGRHVDHLHRLRQRGDDLLGRAVRQAAYDDVALVPVGVLDLDQVRQLLSTQMWKDRIHPLTRMAIGRHQ